MGIKPGMQKVGDILKQKGVKIGDTKYKYKAPKDPKMPHGAAYVTTKGKTTQVAPGHLHKKY